MIDFPASIRCIMQQDERQPSITGRSNWFSAVADIPLQLTPLSPHQGEGKVIHAAGGGRDRQ